jgi:hypothetical protein
MKQYVAYENRICRLRAWLNPEDPQDSEPDPNVPRIGGWRVVIEELEGSKVKSIVRSTWELTIEGALEHVKTRWHNEPVWRDYETGEVVSLKKAI